jgi:Immunity protein 49
VNLSEEAQALAYDTAFWLVGFEEPGTYPLHRLGAVAVELCGKLRGLAIVALLTQGDADKFAHNLMRSGRVREVYLQRMREHGIDTDHHLASGRVAPLMDALAAGDVDLAHRIAWASPRSFSPQREYEDDFAYAQILHRLIHGVTAVPVYEPFLAQFEAALKGAPSARLDVVTALVHRDQAGFELAFAALLAERQKQIRLDLARAQLESPTVLAERQVFIEGLALLRLAQRQGLPTQGEYLYCPSLARRPLRTPLPVAPS